MRHGFGSPLHPEIRFPGLSENLFLDFILVSSSRCPYLFYIQILEKKPWVPYKLNRRSSVFCVVFATRDLHVSALSPDGVQIFGF